MKTPAALLLLALLVGVGCKDKQTATPLKPAADPAVTACSTAKGMEECATCCTAAYNSRFMGGKCECFQR